MTPDERVTCSPCFGHDDYGKSDAISPKPISIFPNSEVSDEMDESRIPKVRRGPMEPTREERLLHDATHLPFRSWCRLCVIANAESNPQLKRKEESETREPRVTYGLLLYEKWKWW